MREYYLEDFKPGDTFTSPSFTLGEEELVAFARAYDDQPFHTDRAAARRTHFGDLVAAGFQTASITWGLAVQSGVFNACSIAGLSIDELRWLKPVHAGDTLTCRFEILQTRRSSSRPGQGLCMTRFDLHNQHGDVVLTMRTTQLLRYRSSVPPPEAQPGAGNG